MVALVSFQMQVERKKNNRMHEASPQKTTHKGDTARQLSKLFNISYL